MWPCLIGYRFIGCSCQALSWWFRQHHTNNGVKNSLELCTSIAFGYPTIGLVRSSCLCLSHYYCYRRELTIPLLLLSKGVVYPTIPAIEGSCVSHNCCYRRELSTLLAILLFYKGVFYSSIAFVGRICLSHLIIQPFSINMVTKRLPVHSSQHLNIAWKTGETRQQIKIWTRR